MRQRLLRLSSHSGVLLGLLAALWSLQVLGAFVTDDAAITLRYAKHLAGGHGVVWNPGEHPVEGYSNFSHVLFGAAAIELGLPPLSALRVLNQVSMLVLCLLVYALTYAALRSRLWASAASVLVGAHAALAYWASSGLETAFYVVATYAGICAAQRVTSARSLWPALAFLVAGLTRLEGPVMFVAVGVALAGSALATRSFSALRLHLSWMAVFGVAYLAYFGWRYHYFGHLLSNSAYFKLDEPSGFTLIEQFATQNPVLLGLAALADWKKLGALGLMLAAITLAYVVGYYGVKDSVADFHRFFLPVFPGLAILAVSAIARLWPPAGMARSRAVLAAVLFALVLGADALHPVSGFANVHAAVERLDTRIVSRAQVASLIAERFGSERAVVADDVGVIGFVLQNPILDSFGLNDARFIHVFLRRRPSYERFLMAQNPALIVAVSRNASKFEPYYASSRLLTDDPSFAHYERLAIVPSTTERYHYFVFARKDLARTPRQRRLPLRRELSTAAMVDDLFRRTLR